MTRAIVRDVDLGAVVPGKRAGVLALITLDNGHDHTKPNTFGARGLLSLNAALDAIAARAAAGEIAAVGVTGKPFILARRRGPGRRRRRDRRRRARTRRRRASGRWASRRSATRCSGGWASCGVPSFGFINGVALGGGLEVALHCTYRTISSGVPMVALPRVLPRPGARLGRRLPAAPADRAVRRAEADHREPAGAEQDAARPRGVRLGHRGRDVRARRLPRGVAALGRAAC